MALALALTLALAVAGCGSKKKSSGNGGGGSLDGAAIVAKSATAMNQLKGATVGFDLSANVGIDAAKVSASNKALLKDPITVNGTVKFNGASVSASKVDLTATAKAGGQSYDVGAKIDGNQGWLGFMGQWYVLPMSSLGQLTSASPTPSASGSPSGVASQLQSLLGVDTNSIVTSNDLVGTETIDGTDAYHVSNKVDAAALATTLSTLAQSSSALTGSSTSTTSAADTIKALQSALKDLKVDTWYEKDNFYLKKLVITAKMDLSSDAQVAAQGIKTVDLKITVTLSDFNADVTVTAPSNPLPIDQLTSNLGSLGSSTGL